MFLVDGGINHDVPEQLHQNLLGIIVPHRRTHGRLLEMKEYIFWRGTRGPVSPCTTHTRGSVKETTTKRGRRPSHSESKQKADMRERAQRVSPAAAVLDSKRLGTLVFGALRRGSMSVRCILRGCKPSLTLPRVHIGHRRERVLVGCCACHATC